MIPPNEFFSTPYMQKKRHTFARTYVKVQTTSELDSSIVEGFVKAIGEATKRNLLNVIKTKMSTADKDLQKLFEIALAKYNGVKK